MKRRLLLLLLVPTAALVMLGMHLQASAQGGQPVVAASSTMQTPPRPDLRSWAIPGMMTQSDSGNPTVACITGRTGIPYSEVFEFYAKKLEIHNYDLKGMTTYHDSVLAMLGSDMNSTGCANITGNTLRATMARRFDHQYVSVSLATTKGSNETQIVVSATTF